MIGIGTIVNTAAIIGGSLIGILMRKGLSERFQQAVMKTLGISTIFIGIGCTMQEMLVIGENGRLSTNGIMLMIFSLVIGTVIGELLRIEDALESIGNKLKKLKVFSKSTNFTEGFITATLVVCVGAMAIVGSLRDGLVGDPSMLYSKSILDFVSTMMFAAAFGVGVLMSAVPLFIYQMSITLLSSFIGDFFSDTIISNLSLVGSVLIFCVGINLFAGKKINVGNMLPSLLVPIIYGIFQLLIKI